MSEATGSTTTMSGCLLAAFRNLAGPGILLALGAALLLNRPRIGSLFDILFLVAAVANVAAGLLYPDPGPSEKSEPGQVRGLSRGPFVAVVIAITVVVWSVTHFVLGPSR